MQSFTAQDPTLELRVQRGPQAGARSPLPPLDNGRGFELQIGGAPHDGVEPRNGPQRRRHDLTLHGASWARLRATPADDGRQIRLELLEGVASIDGRPLPAAMPVAWPMYATLQVADVTLAFGSALEPVWDARRDGGDGAAYAYDDGMADDAAVHHDSHHASHHDSHQAPNGAAHAHTSAQQHSTAAREPTPAHDHTPPRAARGGTAAPHTDPRHPHAHAHTDPRADALAAKPQPTSAQQWQRGLVIAGASLLAASLMLFGFVKLSGFGGKPHNVLLLEQALATKGFTGLVMQADAAGAPRITGTLPSKADEQALEALLERLGAQAKLDIRVPGLTEQVTAFFARIGVQGVRVENLGGGRIEAYTRSASLASAQHQDEAIADARRDISGLTQLTIHNEVPVTAAAASSCGKSVDDPGKRPTSIVWHERSPALNTADGTRYTPGSLLPGGHRLKSIDKDKTVTLECDGRITQLRL